MRRVLVIEDGTEYAEFARLFLARDFEVTAAQSADAALRVLASQPIDVLLIDLRFDRAPAQILIGDLAASAERLFAGDRARSGQVGHLPGRGTGQAGDVEDVHVAVGAVHHPKLSLIGGE